MTLDRLPLDIWKDALKAPLALRHAQFPADLQYMQVVEGTEGTGVRSNRFKLELERAVLLELEKRAEIAERGIDRLLGHLPRRLRANFLAGVREAIPAMLQAERDSIVEAWSPVTLALGNSNAHPNLDFAVERAMNALDLQCELALLSQTGASARPMEILAAERYAGPRYHWSATERLLNYEGADVVAAAREAVGAVEAMGRVVLGESKLTLGEVIERLRKAGSMPTAIGKGLAAIWGYASDEPGLRHAGPHPPTMTDAEAQLLIDVAASAIQYLASLDVPRSAQGELHRSPQQATEPMR